MKPIFEILLVLTITTQAQLFHELPDRPFTPNTSSDPFDRNSRYLLNLFNIKLESYATWLTMQSFPGVDIIDIYDSITGNASPASLNPNEIIDLYSFIDVFAIQNLVTEIYIPAWNSTESVIVAFNSFYDIRYMANWYKNYDFNEELTDDTCLSAQEMWEVLPRWSRWLGSEFQESYFAVKKQGLLLSRANFQYENRNEWIFTDIEMAGIKPSTCLEMHELQYSMNQYLRVLGGLKSQELLKDFWLRVIYRQREISLEGGY